MASNIQKNDFVQGQRSGVYGTVHFPDLDIVDRDLRKQARNTLWDALNEIQMKACMFFRFCILSVDSFAFFTDYSYNDTSFISVASACQSKRISLQKKKKQS